jgi:hypothetical protein
VQDRCNLPRSTVYSAWRYRTGIERRNRIGLPRALSCVAAFSKFVEITYLVSIDETWAKTLREPWRRYSSRGLRSRFSNVRNFAVDLRIALSSKKSVRTRQAHRPSPHEDGGCADALDTGFVCELPPGFHRTLLPQNPRSPRKSWIGTSESGHI